MTTKMMYEYRCQNCDWRDLSQHRGDRLNRVCRGCGQVGPLVRVFAVSIAKPMMPHWNSAVGAEVTGMRDFTNKLKAQEAAQFEKTGIESNYQPIMPGDIKRPNDDGIDATNRARFNAGLKEIK